jgi:hypothetical protein
MKFPFPFRGQVALLALISFTFIQQVKSQAPEVQKAVSFDVSAPLRDIHVKKAAFWKKWTTETEKEIPNKFHIKPVIHPGYMNQADGALQKSVRKEAMNAIITPLVNFNGLDNSDNISGRVTPPDPAGDVGPDHYVQAVNCMLQVFSKAGVSLFGPVETSTLWTGFSGNWDGHNDGDAVVMYDEVADRWIISQFAVDCGTYPNYTEYELVAVSQTADPTGAYYRYAFKFDYMPDYPKMGVWRDGYYIAANRFNTNNSSSPAIGAAIGVLERDKMLVGDASAQMIYYKAETLGGNGSGLGTDCFSMLPGDCDGTFAPAGTPNYFSYINDDSWGGNDELRIWSLKPDWTTPANSVCAYITALPVAAFATFSSYQISQKGVTLKLDDLSDRLMHRMQYRNMGTYESMVTCHTVNSGSNIAGVRWYEMRKNGSTWALYQQGTYAFTDSKSRWLGSIAMNGSGDIALGYTLSGSADYPSIYFTGRKASDALGSMTVAESPIMVGSASMSGADRWGDYAMMSVDPTDNKTFWHTNEFVGTYGGSYPWSTRIASFVFSNTPIIASLPATNITGTTATLNGTVNPNTLATDYHFNWGATTSYGNVTTTTSAGSGSTSAAVNAGITGLTPGSTYHFQLIATNTDGTASGSDLIFIAGQAEVTTSDITGITPTGATGGGNVITDGGSTVNRGICWSTTINPTITNAITTDGTGLGLYTSAITGLVPGTLYHVRAYVTNTAGTVYGNDVTFTSGALMVPVAIAATNLSSSGFKANWNAVDGATSYNLDVSLYQSFSITGGSSTVTEGFSGGATAPVGWTFTNIATTYTSAGNFGAAAPSIKLDATGDAVETPILASAASQLSFWCKGNSTNTESALLVEGYNGSLWLTIDNFSSLPTTGTTKTYSSATIPALPANMIAFRFSYSKSTGNLAFDDVSITSGGSVPSFVPGYEDLTINGTSQAVSGLTATTPYFYRVRAKNGTNTSTSSNVIAVTTTSGGTTPELTITPASLGGFSYFEGNGPSASKSYNLGGYNLTNAPGTITITGSAYYEVSTDNNTFSGSADVAYTLATLTDTPVYIRLKAGLSAGNFNSELIANSGGGAPTVNVSCSGSVTSILAPVITAGSLTGFGNQIVGTISAEKNYTISGLNLTNDIVIAPPAGFEISATSGSGFVANPGTLTLTQTGGVVTSSNVYVRFAPTSVQVYSGNISHSSTGAMAQDVAVSGTGIAASTTPQVVISQVYGGGGNAGAIYMNDFIELFNRGTSSVNLNGWTVQYASTAGTSWSNSTALTNVMLAPGQYYLIKESSGGAIGAALPTSDANGAINMSGTNGKVALVNSTVALSGACPTGTSIIDFVGYGSASCYEGTAATPALSNIISAMRVSNGCTDNNENSTDFTTGTPVPRNSATAINLCSTSTPILSVIPSTLSGFTYMEGSGPSVSQSYALSGSNLTGAPGTITVTGSTNYEVSKDNSTFGSSISIPYSTSTLGSTPVYVALKNSLAAASYDNEVITNAGGGAGVVNVISNGTVTPFTSIPSIEKSVADAYSFQKTIFIDIKDNAKGEVFIYTVAGKLVYSTPAVFGISRYYFNIPGIYIVKIQTTNVNLVKKVLIK